MTSFITLNMQDFGLSDGITETIKTFTPYCVCCLDNSAGFIKLLDCAHANYLQSVLKAKMEWSSYFVCNYCHAILVKIEHFRRQVLESNRLLSNQMYTPTTKHVRATLNTTEIELLDVDELTEVKKDVPNISEPIVTIHEGPEPSNLLTSLNKNVVKKKKPVGSKETKVVVRELPPRRRTTSHSEALSRRKTTKEPMYKRFKGKIRMVTLTEEDMKEDRQRELESEAFLKLPYKCLKCIVGFDHEQNYRDHVVKRHTVYEGSSTCNVCESVLAAGSSYRKHVKNHYTRYECEECLKRYITLLSIMQHYNTAHDSMGITYTCQHCDYTTDIVSAYAYHRNKHRKDLKCKECGKICSSNANLKTHLFAVHRKSNRVYDCTICKKAYNTKSGLEHHMSTLHATAAPSDAFCIECNIQFNSIRCYRAHLRLNSKHITEDSKRYSCNECGAKFVTSSTMKRHVDWVHLKIFNHKCNKCAEEFRTSTLLKRHVSVVHERAPPPRNKICDYCGKGFTTCQVLRSHIRTHTGERPLSCSLCSATFAHNGALYTHYKRVHKANSKGDVIGK